MLLGSLNFQNNLGLLVTFFLASVGLVAMHHTWFNLLGLSVQARGGAPVFLGEEAAFEIRIGVEGRRPRYDIGVRAAGRSYPSIRIPGRDSGVVSIGWPSRQRGICRLDEVIIETRYPVHLFRAWCYAPTDAKTLVYPRPASVAPPPGRNSAGGRSPRGLGGDGMDEYLGPRNYRAGDSPRRIDWKAFARERGLVAKEFGSDAAQEVWIDWALVSAADPETRIGLLTRQVLDAADRQVRFGFRLPGREEPPAGDAAHVHRCLTHLALFNHGEATDSRPGST